MLDPSDGDASQSQHVAWNGWSAEGKEVGAKEVGKAELAVCFVFLS